MKATVLALFLVASFQGPENSNVPQQTPSSETRDAFERQELAGKRADSLADRARGEAVERNRKEKIEKDRKEAREAAK